MKKSYNIFQVLCKSFIIIFLLLVALNAITPFFEKKIQEGIVFTPFDNRTLFTKPWDGFCIPTAPTCQKPSLETPGMIGVFPIGCHCQDTGMATSPLL